MIQAASFLFKEHEKTWNFYRVPRLVDVEDGPLRVPYIEGEIWGNSPLGVSIRVSVSNTCRVEVGVFD